MAGTDRLAITVRSQVPVARGLGSSAALAVAAAAAAGAKDPLAVAARTDGHADNAAASTIGGLVAAARIHGGVHAVRLPLDISLAFVAIVPDVSLSTSRARQVLPIEVSRDSAAFNLSRMALLLAGLADSRLLMPEATEDRLHQDYRSPALPGRAQAAGRRCRGPGHWPCAGRARVPPCSASARGRETAGVEAAATVALADANIPGEVLVLHPDMHGLVLDRDGTGPALDFETFGSLA